MIKMMLDHFNNPDTLFCAVVDLSQIISFIRCRKTERIAETKGTREGKMGKKWTLLNKNAIRESLELNVFTIKMRRK